MIEASSSWRSIPRTMLLLPLQFCILLSLHLLFAMYRLSIVIIHLTAFLPSHPSRSVIVTANSSNNVGSSNSILRDQQLSRWSKSPKHVAIVFVSSAQLNFLSRVFRRLSPRSPRRRTTMDSAEELAELEKLVKDVKALIVWCELLGVESLSVYDEEGILERNSELVKASLSPLLSSASHPKSTAVKSLGRTSFRVVSRSPSTIAGNTAEANAEKEREIDSGCGASEVEALSEDRSSSTTRIAPGSIAGRRTSMMKLNLLSRLSGRPHLASVARGLAVSVAKGKISGQAIDAEYITESIEAAGIDDPDILIVLGGPYLRLRGFPPWQLRLTEMYHHSSPSWLPAPPMTYSILRSALDVYGGAEMRLGR